MVETRMWGERGLVAALCVDLGADHADPGRWACLLEAAFATRVPRLDWGRLADVRAVVEPNFGSTHGFGSPDLVARLGFSDGTVAVLFAEAKCVTYAEASHDPAGRRLRGYNSRINGQIELNHRLAVALQHSRRTDRLIEPDWIDEGTCYILGDKRRSVKRHGVLTKLVPLLSGSEVSSYIHLAITTDERNPFDLKPPAPCMPVILDTNGHDAWHRERQRFGWINWAMIRTLSEGWETSQFRPTYALNEHFIQPEPVPPTAADDAPANVLEWPLGRSGSGVSLALIPSIESRTAVHLSWNRRTCVVRNYIYPETNTGGVPSCQIHRPPQPVFALIKEEQNCGRARPGHEEAGRWLGLIRRQNCEWGLPG